MFQEAITNYAEKTEKDIRRNLRNYRHVEKLSSHKTDSPTRDENHINVDVPVRNVNALLERHLIDQHIGSTLHPKVDPMLIKEENGNDFEDQHNDANHIGFPISYQPKMEPIVKIEECNDRFEDPYDDEINADDAMGNHDSSFDHECEPSFGNVTNSYQFRELGDTVKKADGETPIHDYENSSAGCNKIHNIKIKQESLDYSCDTNYFD